MIVQKSWMVDVNTLCQASSVLVCIQKVHIGYDIQFFILYNYKIFHKMIMLRPPLRPLSIRCKIKPIKNFPLRINITNL
ncbi:hypothetical protein BpHYR1_054206 [Brachionus plicatilis]|uniref:Uncharacterized protein n=1 Tax=Brachionus plicatilis TaxID=10195 RepID=A0A3M7RJL3_BRAPC|nr:hypothetical protein BpHYR1_054206 [Brachionus plicatilis]